MNTRRAAFYLPCLLMPLAAMFTECATTTTLDSPGHAQPVVPVTPSLAVPEPGLHIDVLASVGRVEPTGSSYGGPSVSAQASLLWQPGLESDAMSGPFVAVTSRAMISQVQILSERAPDSTPSAQRARLATRSLDIVGDGDLRVGLQVKTPNNPLFDLFNLASKMPSAGYSVYAHGVVQYERGEYFNYRRRVDGVGQYYNLSYDPVTLGFGLGADFSAGKTGVWSLGETFEVTTYFSRSQTFVSSENTGLGTPDNVTTSPQGKEGGSFSFSEKPHLDIGNYSIFGCISLAVSFGEPGLVSYSAGMSYRW